MLTLVPENRTPAGPAALRNEAWSRKDLPAWQKLEQHAAQMRKATLRELFATDPDRASTLAVEGLGMYADFSKNRISAETVELLVKLAEQCGLEEKIAAMFTGEKINVSEDRAVLHTALRAPREATIEVDGQNVVAEVHEVLAQMAHFANAVRSGQWKGHTGATIRNIINIGIGGSDLGPRMAHQALRRFSDRKLRLEFVSNVDGAEFAEAIRDLDPAETLFIVSSKSWRTLEALTNAATAREWTLAAFDGDAAAIASHFVAVSTNIDGVTEFGIDPSNMFGFWDWVGGRYSMDSAIGLSTMIAIGPKRFREMLDGFHAIDTHFQSTPLDKNMPALMGLLALWNNDFLGASTVAVLPYAQYMKRFPAYLQQLTMESNGKHVTMDGEPVGVETGPIYWGEPGTRVRDWCLVISSASARHSIRYAATMAPTSMICSWPTCSHRAKRWHSARRSSSSRPKA